VAGTGERCVCSWPCREPHARPRGDRAVPNLPFPATGGTRAGLGGSAPIHALGRERTPAVIRLCSRKSERVPSAAKPQTSDNEGPRRPPTAGTTHRGHTSVPVRGEYPSRPSPCGRLGGPVTPRTGRIPPKGPRRAQHYRRQSVAYTGRNYSLLMAGAGRDTTRTAWHLLSRRLNRPDGSPASLTVFHGRAAGADGGAPTRPCWPAGGDLPGGRAGRTAFGTRLPGSRDPATPPACLPTYLPACRWCASGHPAAVILGDRAAGRAGFRHADPDTIRRHRAGRAGPPVPARRVPVLPADGPGDVMNWPPAA
jgi:hypothetical protein